jgi:hypothetical protein
MNYSTTFVPGTYWIVAHESGYGFLASGTKHRTEAQAESERAAQKGTGWEVYSVTE